MGGFVTKPGFLPVMLKAHVTTAHLCARVVALARPRPLPRRWQRRLQRCRSW